MRDFNTWLKTFRQSIADYHYYTDFNNVFRNTNQFKVELNILNSLVGSENIEEEFKEILRRYPECLAAVPILLAKREGKIVGVFCYACICGEDKHFVIREPIFQNEQDLQHAIYHLTGNETDHVLCTGYGCEEIKPMIMAKVLNPEFDFNLKKAKIFINEEV